MFFSLLILLLTTVGVMTGAQLVIFEQRNAANTMREHQAYQAAMSGIEHAYAYVANGGVDQNGNNIADTLVSPSSPAGAPGGGSYAVEFCNPGTTLPASANTSCGSFNLSGGDATILVYARGWSDDETGVQHMIEVLKRKPGVADTPANPVTTKGIASINGAGDVTNPEGTSTIWSGDSITLTNANFKTNILSPSGNGSIVETSNRDTFGPDVIQNDGNLSNLSDDAFFANFFGTTPTDYKTSHATHVFAAADIGDHTTSDIAGRAILWSEGNTSIASNSTFGTPSNPVILIIDGDLSSAGNITINGFLYVTGDMSGTGSVEVNGAIVVEEDMNVTGSLDVVFNSAILANLQNIGKLAQTTGSWKDWKEW